MLTMHEINCIKIMRNHYLSITYQKLRKLIRRTAKKYADEDQLPVERARYKSEMMYDEKWREFVGDWPWENQKFKKKDRRTNEATEKHTFSS